MALAVKIELFKRGCFDFITVKDGISMDKNQHFNTITFQHEKTLLEARNTRITPSMYKAISDAMDHNNPVGSLIGYYDEKLSISFASQSFLYELGFDEEDFQSGTENSLLRLISSQDLYLFSPDNWYARFFPCLFPVVH